MDLVIPSILILIALGFDAYFLILVIKSNGRTEKSIALLSFILSILIQSALQLLAPLAANNYDLYFFIEKTAMLFVPVMTFFLFRLCLLLVNEKAKIPSIISLILLAGIFLVTFLTDNVVSGINTPLNYWDINFHYERYWSIPRVFATITLILCWYILLKEYLKSKDEIVKNKLKFIFLGLVIPALSQVILFAILPLLGIHLERLFSISLVLANSLFLYTIYKWNAFDVKLSSFGIKSKIRLALFGTTFVLTLSAISVFNYFNKSLRDEAVQNELFTVTESRYSHITTWIDNSIQTTMINSNCKSFINYLKADPQETEYKILEEKAFDKMEQMADEDRHILEVALINNKNETFSNTTMELTQNELIDSQEAEDIYIHEIHWSERYKVPSINITTKVVDDYGNKLGILAINFNINDLYEITAETTGLQDTGETYLVSEDLTMVSPSRFFPGLALNQQVLTNNTSNCFQTKPRDPSDLSIIEGYENYVGEKVVGTSMFIESTNWCLVTEIQESEVNEVIYRYVITTISIALLVNFILNFLAIRLSNIIIKPITRLQKNIGKIEEGNYSFKVGTDTKDEIGDLSRAFDRLSKTIRKSREEIDQKVKAQTQDIEKQKDKLEEQQEAILNILEDVDEEKRKVALEKARDEAIILAIGDGLIVTNKDGVIVMVNKSFEDMLGVTSQDAIGKPLTKVVKMVDKKDKPVPDKIRNRPLQLFKGKIIENSGDVYKSATSSYYYVRKDGSKFPVATTKTPIIIESEIIGYVEVFKDITVQTEIDRMKTEFVSVASHQLRTPLTAIKWYTKMLISEDSGKLNEMQKEFTKEVYNGANRMIGLINDLLNVSRLETGRLKIDPTPTQLIKLIERVIKETSHVGAKKNCKITFDKPKEELPIMPIDQVLFGQVVENLLSNAIRYSPADKCFVKVNIEKEKNQYIISVKDNGIGIPQSAQKRIFEKFVRADNAQKMAAEGSGLGLYIVKLIVDSYGGKIWFKSKENKGTTFFVSIPKSGMLAKEGEKGLAVAKKIEEINDGDKSKKTNN
jgi:PAS domain S-box-containing protein